TMTSRIAEIGVDCSVSETALKVPAAQACSVASLPMPGRFTSRVVTVPDGRGCAVQQDETIGSGAICFVFGLRLLDRFGLPGLGRPVEVRLDAGEQLVELLLLLLVETLQRLLLGLLHRLLDRADRLASGVGQRDVRLARIRIGRALFEEA